VYLFEIVKVSIVEWKAENMGFLPCPDSSNSLIKIEKKKEEEEEEDK
jgi:hypothetical protein